MADGGVAVHSSEGPTTTTCIIITTDGLLLLQLLGAADWLAAALAAGT
jgi:hypothetical protein